MCRRAGARGVRTRGCLLPFRGRGAYGPRARVQPRR
jgi:hypothetical protein